MDPFRFPFFDFRFAFWILGCLLATHLMLVHPIFAQTGTGRLFKSRTAYKDASQRYAVYLPSQHDKKNTLPVLFLMDPRGRALLPIALFQDAAERFGYIVMSSYNTLSDADSAGDANASALKAMLYDARARFNANTSRIYLVGFSGTAHYAWSVAPQMDGLLAGVIGVGSGFPISIIWVHAALPMQRPIAYFGIAGNGDFNYDSARLLDHQLDTTRIAHRFMTFDGFHAWPPKNIAEAAVEWLQYQAMRTVLATRNKAWMDSLCSTYLDEANALEKRGLLTDAMRRYREVAADCEDSFVSAEARQQMDRLAQNKAVKKVQKLRNKLAEKYYDHQESIRKFTQDYRKNGKPMKHEKAVKRLNIKSLQQQAGDTTNTDVANSARRMLANTFAVCAFYEPRDYMNKEDYARAAGFLKLAQAIYPNVPRICYWLAQAQAQLNQTEAALDALACAVNGRWSTPEKIQQDEKLKPLHGSFRFWEIIKQE